MPDFNHVALFMLAALALNLTPGPDILYVITRSVSQGRSAGVFSALGIGGGSLVHTLAVTAGLSALLQRVPLAYDVVRLGGAGYLIYLGVQALRSTTDVTAASRLSSASNFRIFLQGMVTNVLNPKVALFFLAFLPQAVQQERGPVALQLLLLGCLFNLSGTTVNVGVAMLAGRLRRWFSDSGKSVQRMHRASSVVFIALGLRIAFSDRH